jgi:FKBP-type peptidyl-prolyl cis-trans isomerase (trigger factor)
MKTTVKKLPKSEVEIEGELESELFESYFTKALKKLGENLELPGFRKGKAPEAVLLKTVPEIRILKEMAELALAEHYPKIIEAEQIDAISQPEISITKLARKNPLGFKIKTATLPIVKLPDYKAMAKKVIGEITEAEKNVEVTEKDLEDTILDIRKSRTPKKHITNIATETDSAKDGPSQDSKDRPLELPEFNDAFVKSLGPFENVQDFKDKLRANIKLEKENLQKENRKNNRGQ